MANLKNFFGQLGKAVVVALSWMIGFPTGLIIFNPITILAISTKRRWRKRLADLLDDGGPLAIAAGLMGIITFAIMLVAACVVLNPLTVWGMALIAPRWVAEKSTAAITDGFWRMVVGIPLSWQGWIGHLLPWRCRRYFVEERFDRYSSKDRMRLTLSSPSLFFSLSDKEKELVFTYFKTSAAQRMEWVKKRAELNGEMFAKLCRDGAEAVLAYNKLHQGLTSEEFVIMLNNSSSKELANICQQLQLDDEKILFLSHWEQHFNILLTILERQGCGKQSVKQLLEYVKNKYSDINVTSKLLEALSCWRQKGQVSQLVDKPELFKQLLKSEELCAAAQAKMSVEQYCIFNGCGKQLDEAALLYFLRFGSADMVKAIFAKESNWQACTKANELVKSSPELSNLLLEVQVAAAAKK